VSPKADLYETQARKAPWRGKVDGQPAYIDRFKGQWEVCCRVSAGSKGLAMFKLASPDAVRRLADVASPPLPETLLAKVVRAAGGGGSKLVAVLVLAFIIAAIACVFVFFPGAIDAIRSAM